jgi:hypothetical protein
MSGTTRNRWPGGPNFKLDRIAQIELLQTRYTDAAPFMRQTMILIILLTPDELPHSRHNTGLVQRNVQTNSGNPDVAIFLDRKNPHRTKVDVFGA